MFALFTDYGRLERNFSNISQIFCPICRYCRANFRQHKIKASKASLFRFGVMILGENNLECRHYASVVRVRTDDVWRSYQLVLRREEPGSPLPILRRLLGSDRPRCALGRGLIQVLEFSVGIKYQLCVMGSNQSHCVLGFIDLTFRLQSFQLLQNQLCPIIVKPMISKGLFLALNH